ncbi:AAA family ATPase [Kitasatospora sp. NA04385]|uniref:AAA family ATPase n=1 Tax=Kitasatospora sp. NA04385 TaxID=2742135 RepID=UPI0015908EFA|nr:AAA family ATPase [Kitasatospora sp. NA04385]QKW21646.1 AAA family ATPase [Kitasatospora sp. NA04385]
MITQIRIDGFKSFVGFELDVHPVTVLLGVNGAGKSNLFDALRLVAGTVRQGFSETLAGDRRLAVRDLFHRGGVEREPLRDEFTITVGMLVPSPDGPLPVRVRLCARLLGSRAGMDPRRSRIWVSALKHTDWMDRLGYPDELRSGLRETRDAFVRRTGVSVVGLRTRRTDRLLQDQEALPLPDMPQAWELLGLVAQECGDWQPYVLEPAALRELGRPEADGLLEPRGSNLAVVVRRIEETAPERFTRLVADLAALVPGVRGIRTEMLRTRGEFDFEVEFEHTGWVSPASLSDGTLRALALLAAYWDPERTGLLAVEEIENGMHLAQVSKLVRRLGRGTGLSGNGQLLVTTHSPALLASLRNDVSGGVVFLEQANHVDPRSGTVSRITVPRPLLPRTPDTEPGTSMTPQAVERLLRALGQATS